MNKTCVTFSSSVGPSVTPNLLHPSLPIRITVLPWPNLALLMRFSGRSVPWAPLVVHLQSILCCPLSSRPLSRSPTVDQGNCESSSSTSVIHKVFQSIMESPKTLTSTSRFPFTFPAWTPFKPSSVKKALDVTFSKRTLAEPTDSYGSIPATTATSVSATMASSILTSHLPLVFDRLG